MLFLNNVEINRFYFFGREDKSEKLKSKKNEKYFLGNRIFAKKDLKLNGIKLITSPLKSMTYNNTGHFTNIYFD